MMSNESARALAVVPRSIEETASLAERLSQSSLLPAAMRGKMPDVLVTIMAGAEMGLPPMASLRAFHVLDGKPILSSDGMVAIIQGSGKCAYFDRVEESDTFVTYETHRVGAKSPRRCTWTIEMAKRAGLHLKDNWRLYPRAMLASRAKSELARDVYSDVLMGCYTDDEIEGSGGLANSTTPPPPQQPQPSKSLEIEDAEVIADNVPEIAAIDAAKTPQELMGMLKQLQALTGDVKKLARERYAAKLKTFEAPEPEQTTATEANEVSP